jgi:hypothetical protein
MKFLICFFVLMSSAYATHPQLGEYNVLEGTQSGARVRIKNWYALYSEGRMIQRTEVSVNGGPAQIEDEWIEEEELFNRASAQLVLGLCQALGGAYETLTLPVGTFNTCKIASVKLDHLGLPALPSFIDADEIWFGEFAVNGIARFRNAAGVLDVTSYLWN